MTMPVTDPPDAASRRQRPKPQMLYSSAACVVSLLVAGTLSLVLTLYPQAVIRGGEAPEHSALMLSMWGIAAGFVHGVGFVPRNPLLRIALGPLAAWLLMAGGTFLLMNGQ